MVQHGMQCQYSVEQAPQEAPYRPSKLAIHRKEEMLGLCFHPNVVASMQLIFHWQIYYPDKYATFQRKWFYA